MWNIERTYASLRIWGRDIDPQFVTTQLGITPWKAHRRGDRRGQTQTWEQGMWIMRSEHHVTSNDFAQHVAWIIEQVEPVAAQLQNLLNGEPETEADILCFLEVNASGGGPTLSAALLGRIARLKLDLGIDIYIAN